MVTASTRKLSVSLQEAIGEVQWAARQSVEANGQKAVIRPLNTDEEKGIEACSPKNSPLSSNRLVALDVRFRNSQNNVGFGTLILPRFFSQRALSESPGDWDGYGRRLEKDSSKRDIAMEVMQFFEQNFLHPEGLPIELMVPQHIFLCEPPMQDQSLDEISMSCNNSSAYSARPIRQTGRWSHHAIGALDLNPLYNPLVMPTERWPQEQSFTDDWSVRALKSGWVEIAPKEGEAYATNRQRNPNPYLLHRSSFATQFFRKLGWTWGGNWSQIKDYQHFSPGLE